MVHQSYWHLARVYNAAVPKDPSAAEKLDELNEAYSVLSSPAVRQEYDRRCFAPPVAESLPTPHQPASESADPVATVAEPAGVSAEPEAQRPRTRARLKLPRPTLPRFDMKWIRFPSRRSAVGAAIILVMAPAAFVVGHQAFLLIALLVIALAVTAIRLVRRPLRLPRLGSLPALRPPAVRGPRLPEPSLHARTDADALHRSTKAMLQRLQQAARRSWRASRT